MKKQYFIFLLFLTSVITPVSAQIALGEWRSHLPFWSGKDIAIVKEKVFCATNAVGMFSYNTNDNSLEKHTTIQGLSDVSIDALEYSSENDILLVAYDNSNIDLIQGNEIYTISDIQQKQILGDKSINEIIFINNSAYLACGFGIVVVDLDKKEIKESYIIGDNGQRVNVFDLAFDSESDTIYAASETGIYRANINNPNLLNFANWKKITELPFYNNSHNAIAFFQNKLYINYNGQPNNVIYQFDPLSYEYNEFLTNLTNTKQVSVSQDKLLIISQNKLVSYEQDLSPFDNIEEYQSNLKFNAQKAVYDSNNLLWIADWSNGLVHETQQGNFENMYPQGPASINSGAMDYNSGSLYVVPGGNENVWLVSQLYHFNEENWENRTYWDARNLIDVVVDPHDASRCFAASWGWGLFEYTNYGQNLTIHNDKNTDGALQNIYPGTDKNYVRITGLTYDDNNNLWISNSGGVDHTVSVLDIEGNWKSFNYGKIVNEDFIGELIVTQNNHKWVILPRGKGLFAFDNGVDIYDESDDQTKKFRIKDHNGKDLSNYIYSIAEDHDGTIWIGTNEGVLVYYNPENVFSGENFYAQHIIVEIDGTAQYLLATETITAIAVDGANRKWFGTQNGGVFLMSEDGTEQIYNFNTDNSPLFSNNISSIEIDDNTGEVFFGTARGIISYKASATKGQEEFQEVYAFPNPVRPDYHGDITIRGLVTNVNVKITDISGNLVYETTAKGGQAIWPGTNFNGQRVRSGVYLVFCTNEDGSKTHITKILFIN